MLRSLLRRKPSSDERAPDPVRERANERGDLNATEQALVRFLQERGADRQGVSTTQAEIAAAIDKGMSTTRRALSRLRSLGLVFDDQRQGQPKFTIRLTQPSAAEAPSPAPEAQTEETPDELDEDAWDQYLRESPAAATAELVHFALEGFAVHLEQRLEPVFQAVDRLERAAVDLLLELGEEERKAALHASPALSEMTHLAGDEQLRRVLMERENGRRPQPTPSPARRDVEALARQARRAASEEAREQAPDPEVDPVAEILAEIDEADRPIDLFGRAPAASRED